MARLFLVVDTNILLTHLAVLEHLREVVRKGSALSKAADDSEADDVDIIVVVPWIVLYELDRIKSERPDSQGASLFRSRLKMLKLNQLRHSGRQPSHTVRHLNASVLSFTQGRHACVCQPTRAQCVTGQVLVTM